MLLQAEAVRDCLGLTEIARHDTTTQVEVLRLWIEVRPHRDWEPFSATWCCQQSITYLLDIASALLLTTYCKCMHQVRSEKATLSLRGKDEA
eukprot:COSAG01_NODE_4010_length_5437_cov_5.981828_4_plen_92_part_00